MTCVAESPLSSLRGRCPSDVVDAFATAAEEQDALSFTSAAELYSSALEVAA
jgi:hypothetical protein